MPVRENKHNNLSNSKSKKKSSKSSKDDQEKNVMALITQLIPVFQAHAQLKKLIMESIRVTVVAVVMKINSSRMEVATIRVDQTSVKLNHVS